jgi:glycosyltransferase involved in cell wall biosynthesis/GT2 family glycosyltransferase
MDLIDIERQIVAPFFDAAFYRRSNPDLLNFSGDLLTHFMIHGSSEQRSPHPNFSHSAYLAQTPDVSELGANAFAHYLVSKKIVSVKHYPYFLNKSERDIYQIIAEKFDQSYYRMTNPDLTNADFDLPLHYIRDGWRERRNPSALFDTAFYLSENPDIQKSGVNPFWHYIVHGRIEGREPCTHSQYVLAMGFEPKISVIIPCFNHARFLRERVISILKQNYSNLEIIFLDDKSTDDSLPLFRQLMLEFGFDAKIILNDKNSGSIFGQWRKGFQLATGDLVWICESDDYCEPNFLSELVRHFADRSVMLAFGRIQFCDSNGVMVHGLDSYRDASSPGNWGDTVKQPAAHWFKGAFSEKNLIPNVGGCLFRNQNVEDVIWNEVELYRVVGDWCLYMALSRTGQIVYQPTAVSYFRQHGQNSSTRSFTRDEYYREHFQIAKQLKVTRGAPNLRIARMYSNLIEQFSMFHSAAGCEDGRIGDLFDIDDIIQTPRSRTHIVIFIRGFFTGGGEIYPINLSNELMARGYDVSVVVLTSADENEEVRKRLDCRIPVYTASQVREQGRQNWLDSVGADIVHTHYIGAEFLLLSRREKRYKQSYIVSLHGSYEITFISDELQMKMLRFVDRWYYLHRKNLSTFDGLPLAFDRFQPVVNGISFDSRPFERSRSNLGFGPRDFVFAIVSRAIPEKGWSEAIRALRIAQARVPDRRLGLILCGDGSSLSVAQAEANGDPSFVFVGYQDRVQGLYRLANCALLPTRFLGESFPLTILEAFASKRPVIATDVGMISEMVNSAFGPCGLLVPNSSCDEEFIRHLSDAMVEIVEAVSPADRANMARRSLSAARTFEFGAVVDSLCADYDALAGLMEVKADVP